MNNQIIPIIEEVPGKGYWEINPNTKEKIWHNESNWNNKMEFKNYKEVNKKYDMGGGGDWLNLEEGDNKVRLVAPFNDYAVHYDKVLNKSFVCIGKDKMCPYCQRGEKARVQFLGWAIDRKDGQIKLLRIGYQVFEAIGKLANNEEYAFEDVPNYDITINRTGQGLDTTYSVLPARKETELTEEEQVQIKELKPAQEVIEKMKEKASKSGLERKSESKDDEDVDIKDIPF